MNRLLLAFLLLLPAAFLAAQTERPYTPIQVPTRDGKMLAADLYANNLTTTKPVILIQTPYNKNFYRLSVAIPSQAGGASFPYDSANYNYVTVDWRGFYGSKNAAVTGYDRGLDGYDAVEWIATQPWCNGKVGTWGPSALGAIQFMTAKHHPPHLLCAVPLVKDFKTKYGDYYEGGVYRKEHSETLQAFLTPVNATLLILGVFLSALALGTLLMESGSEERYLELSLRATPKFALALAFVFMVVSAGVAFLVVFMGKVFVADLTAGRAARMEASVETTIPMYIKAIRLYPQEGRYFTRASQGYMTLANIEGRKVEGERDVNRIAFLVREGVASGNRAKDLMPNDVLSVQALGLIYENASIFATDALPRAEEAYKRALELEPQNPLFQIKLGQIKRLTADGKQDGAEKTALHEEALGYFEKAVEKKPDLAIAHYNAAVAEARLKRVDAAIESTRDALRLAPANLSFKYNLGALHQLRNGEGDRDTAERLYKEVLTTNERLIDVRLSLGLLYDAKRD